jgi:hypothetical protein
MTKNKPFLILGVIAALSVLAVGGAFGLWRYYKYRHNLPPPQGVLLRDRSDSILGSCGDLAAMAREMLASSQFEPGSSLALMVTGDDATAGEPVLLDSFELPVTRRVIEGRSKNAQRQQELVDKLIARCEQSGQTKKSPIYLAIRRATEYLHAQGCQPGSSCWLYVQSDLEELAEKRIRDQINGAPVTFKKTSDAPELPTAIDNTGINVTICGLAETSGTTGAGSRKRQTLTSNHDAQRADRIRSVWGSLFTDPQRVKFSPACPKN